ncbi:uncharacterized protein LOC121414249 isoform X1 [Lytechinus variegatus]|uniref:uncharacterized protein LOC121414249 isoform X1 n=1 Tax=Lytechinus variegatus TaxID=7654 RepID=UPI001BB2979D|nr:uncharacterized protein LOC121414249 isoform X1 [Lytechinus variegatus]
MRLYSRLWISLVIMVVVATFPPSLSSTCSKPINLYREGKLERVDEGKLNMNLCPIKQTQDGQLVQTILKVIQRWAPITSCPGRANNTNESPIFACRFPDTNITGSSAMGVASWIMDTTVDVGSEDTTVNPTTSIPTKECLHTNSTCERGWDTFGCKCYKYISMYKYWTWHSDNCKNEYNATMLVIESKEENEFILQAYGKMVGDIWLGCFCGNNSLYWSCLNTDAKWSDDPNLANITKGYWNWSAGDPNDDHKEESACLRVNVGWNILRMHGKWRDRECRKFSYKSVCQKDLE